MVIGTFRVEIGIGNPMGGDLRAVSALVDTGATHSMMPASLLAGLSVVPSRQRRFRLADGSGLEYGVGAARVRINDREEVCPVIFGPEGQYLLGATTLEIFELTVDSTAPNPHLAPAAELYL